MYEIKKMYTRYNQSKEILISRGVIIHSTGNIEDSVTGNFNYFNRAEKKANAHIFIDKNTIGQFVPFNMQAWHAKEPANSQYFGIELCETKNIENFKIIWDKAIWTTTFLLLNKCNCKITKVNIDNVRSHYEENKINHYGRGHTDPTAYLAKFSKNMDIFRQEVQKSINKILIGDIEKMFKDILEASGWAKDSINRLSTLGIIKGDENNNFNPKSPITKEELAVVIDRVLKLLNK